MTTLWFTFNQNNSGGSFDSDDKVGHYVFIQAETAEQANEFAQSKAGIYFDGCDTGTDCSCCGDRWYPVYNNGSEYPAPYGGKLEEESFLKESVRNTFFSDRLRLSEEDNVHFYFFDGAHECVTMETGKLIEEKQAKDRIEAKKLWAVNFTRRNQSEVTRVFQNISPYGRETYYNAQGNFPVEKAGWNINGNYGWATFASTNKETVEKAVRAYAKVRSAYINDTSRKNLNKDVEKAFRQISFGGE